MQSKLILCVLALASSADAKNLRQEPVQVPVPVTDFMTTQPQFAVEQEPMAPSMQPVTDAIQSAQSRPSQPAPGGFAQAVLQLPASSSSAQQTAPMTSQVNPRNVTKIAFGQIKDLATEFHQLREDDAAHVKQLGVDIHLRESLEQQLVEAEERLEHDNGELAQETTGIAITESDNAMKLPQNSTGDAPSALIQDKSTKFHSETDQIALATVRDVKTLNEDINTLHLRDVNEVKALRGNAETRSALSTQIAKEREELINDSGGLATNLGKIRDLVVSSDAAPLDADSNGQATSSEALVQQDVQASKEQETTPSAEIGGAAATSSSEAPRNGT